MIFAFDIVGDAAEPLALGIVTKKRLFISVLVSMALAMPMGGFVFGFIQPGVPNLFGRMFYGVVYAILATGCLGFPPEALEDHAQSCNVWPYIITSGLIILGICTAFSYHKSRPKSPS